MTLRRTIAFVAVAALAACGGDKKSEEKGNTPEGASKLAGDVTAGGGAAGGSGAYAAGDTGPTSSLFGGRFKGIFSKNKSAKQANLEDVFAKDAEPAMNPVAAPAQANAAAPTGQAENLWAFAPQNAAFGMVVGDGALGEVAGAAVSIKAAVSKHPAGAMVLEMMMQELADAKIDPFDLAGWAGRSGVDLAKGAAMFASVDGDVVVVLPVTDPAAFRKAIGDDDGDLGDKHCVMASPGRYVCGEKLASAQAAAKPHDSPLAKRVARLPGWLRGDAELVAHLASFEDAMKDMADLRQMMSTIGLVAAAVNLENGTVSMRGWLEGKRGGPIGDGFAATPAATLTGQSAGATNWFHFRLPMGLITQNIPPGSVPKPLADGLVSNLTGEVVTYSRGKSFLSEMVVFGLKDGARTAPLVDMGCAEVGKMGLLQKMKKGPGVCSGEVDLGKLLSDIDELAPFVKGMPMVPVGVRVQGNSLEIMLGRPQGPAGKAGDLASGRIAAELVTGNWNAVFWGMATDPVAVAPVPLQKRLVPVLQSLPDDAQMQASLARWVYGHIYDAGLAFALREDGMYLMAEVGTFAGDPPAAYADHQKALEKLVNNDMSAYLTQIKANAATHRGTRAGNHAAAVNGGGPMLGQLGIWGVLAGIGAWSNKVDDGPPPDMGP